MRVNNPGNVGLLGPALVLQAACAVARVAI